MKRFLFLMILFAFPIFSQTGDRKYDLEECLRIAEQNNYDIQISRQRVNSSRAQRRNAFGNFLPNINFNMGYSRQLNVEGGKTANIGGQIINVPAQDPDSYNMQAVARLNIFDGFSRESNYNRASENYEASKLNSRQTDQLVLLRIYSNFINVIKNKKIVEARKENLQIGKRDLDRIQAQFDAGVVPKTAVYSQEADIGNREIQLISAETQLKTSKAALMESMGVMPNMNADFNEESLPEQITETDILKFRRSVGSMKSALNRALAKRPDLKASKKLIDAAESSVKISQSSYFPTLSASGGWNWSNSEFNEFSESARSYVGMNLSVPIFQNFSVQNNIQQSKLQLKQREIEKNRLEQQIRTRVQTAYINLESSEQSLNVSKISLRSARLNYESTKERFDVGDVSVTELQIANSQYIQAQINYITSVYDYINSQKEVLYSVGELK